ncbi:hypothetical protein NL676_019127 [Syzygium grande]|nr:hypothetical protein NL676_019127 [Syzygium grande]
MLADRASLAQPQSPWPLEVSHWTSTMAARASSSSQPWLFEFSRAQPWQSSTWPWPFKLRPARPRPVKPHQACSHDACSFFELVAMTARASSSSNMTSGAFLSLL